MTDRQPYLPKILGQALLTQLLLFMTSSLIISYSAYFELNQTVLTVISSVLAVLTFGLPILFYCKCTRIKVFSLRHTADPRRPLSSQKLILLFFAAVSLTVTAVNLFGMLSEALFSMLGFTATESEMKSIPLFAAVFFRNVIIAAFFEELLFRGVVLHSASGKTAVFKIIISGLLFSLMHCDFTQFLYAFAAGITIAFFALLTGSLVFAVAVHFSQNLITFIFTVIFSNSNSKFYNSAVTYSFLFFATVSVIFIFLICFFRPLKIYIRSQLCQGNGISAASEVSDEIQKADGKNEALRFRIHNGDKNSKNPFFCPEIRVYIIACVTYAVVTLFF